jgi:hypothetical protein
VPSVGVLKVKEQLMNEFVAGKEWRVIAHQDGRKIEIENKGVFDDIVVDQWLHIEHMHNNTWWIRIGDARIQVYNSVDNVKVDIERGFYDDINGITDTHGKPANGR